jgi:putative transposase
VRYERPHSNDLWHADFSEPEDGKQVIAYIDDASRKVVGKGKFDNATTDNALLVLDKSIKEFGKPKQVMTDHGTQFCADEEKTYRFREELKKRGIEHIMSAVKRPQSNGKIERWFGSMDRLYKRFEYDLDKFVECYNNMPHLSLDTTPNIAYLEKMPRKVVDTITNKR